jgi:2-oxoisovalerate dehydrogenase E1 component
MVERCELAAGEFGGQVEVIDLRTLVPWDEECVLKSLQKTGKCLIVHEDITFGGFGAEIAAIIAEKGFMNLDGPVRRVAAPAVPVPFSTNLMAGVVPEVARIKQAIAELLEF